MIKNKILFIGVVYIALIFISNIGFGQSFETVLDQFANGKFNNAAETIRKLDPQSSKAKTLMCQLYADKLIDTNVEEASKYCKDAVEAKEPIAIYIYAIAHLNGNNNIKVTANNAKALGFMSMDIIDHDFALAYDFFCEKFVQEKNFSEAISFCKIASSKGMRRSLYYMGLMTALGKGIIQDFNKSKDFMLASATLNNPSAYMFLGEMTRDGLYGESKDAIQAYAWFTLAASVEPDNSEALENMLKMKLNNHDIISSQKIASKWKAKTPKLLDFYRTN